MQLTSLLLPDALPVAKQRRTERKSLKKLEIKMSAWWKFPMTQCTTTSTFCDQTNINAKTATAAWSPRNNVLQALRHRRLRHSTKLTAIPEHRSTEQQHVQQISFHHTGTSIAYHLQYPLTHLHSLPYTYIKYYSLLLRVRNFAYRNGNF